MEFNSEELSNLLVEGNLTRTDLARLLSVSRVTIHNWLKGGEPHHLIASKYHKVVTALKAAIEAGDLPISARSLDKRHAELVAIVKSHL